MKIHPRIRKAVRDEFYMCVLSVQLADELRRQLDQEAKLARKGRSDLIRLAVEEYLQRHEKDRVIQEMAAEMREWVNDTICQQESRRLIESADDGLNAIVRAERSVGIDPDRRWWK